MDRTFLTQLYDEKGNSLAQEKYDFIAQQIWFITKYTSNSYADVLKLSPTERDLLIKNIQDEMHLQHEQLEKFQQESEARRNNR